VVVGLGVFTGFGGSVFFVVTRISLNMGLKPIFDLGTSQRLGKIWIPVFVQN